LLDKVNDKIHRTNAYSPEPSFRQRESERERVRIGLLILAERERKREREAERDRGEERVLTESVLPAPAYIRRILTSTYFRHPVAPYCISFRRML
jgi:hypothetical protein